MQIEDCRMQIERSGTDLRRLFLLAVVLPATMVLVDRLAIPATDVDASQTVGACALLVGQVGLLGWLVGRGLRHPVLCCTVYAWGLLLADLWVFSLHSAYGDNTLIYAMISAQTGLMAVWAILGTGSWQWRLPAIVLIAVFLGYFCLPYSSAGNIIWPRYDLAGGWGTLRDSVWTSVLLIQCLTIAAVNVVLRVSGIRLLQPAPQGAGQAPPRTGEHRQFNIRHMLVWTTVVSVVLAATKGLDWLFVRSFFWFDLLLIVLLGVVVAVVSLIAMWSALGRSGWFVRISMLTVLPPLLGALFAWLVDRARNSQAPHRWVSYMSGDSALWIVWMALAAGLLAAMLLAFRARGYRLMRERARGETSSRQPP